MFLIPIFSSPPHINSFQRTLGEQKKHKGVRVRRIDKAASAMVPLLLHFPFPVDVKSFDSNEDIVGSGSTMADCDKNPFASFRSIFTFFSAFPELQISMEFAIMYKPKIG